MSDQLAIVLVLPFFVIVLAALWVLFKVSRHSNFVFRLSGFGVKVELVSNDDDDEDRTARSSEIG